eukprot:UN22957
MKLGLLLLLLLPIVYSQSGCEGKPNGAFFRDPSDCGTYYRCIGGNPLSFTCPAGLWFDEVITDCNFPFNVVCDPDRTTTISTTANFQSTRRYLQESTCQYTSSEKLGSNHYPAGGPGWTCTGEVECQFDTEELVKDFCNAQSDCNSIGLHTLTQLWTPRRGELLDSTGAEAKEKVCEFPCTVDAEDPVVTKLAEIFGNAALASPGASKFTVPELCTGPTLQNFLVEIKSVIAGEITQILERLNDPVAMDNAMEEEMAAYPDIPFSFAGNETPEETTQEEDIGYDWVVDEWDIVCDPTRSDCTPRNRDVKCVGSHGITVADGLCETQKPDEMEECCRDCCAELEAKVDMLDTFLSQLAHTTPHFDSISCDKFPEGYCPSRCAVTDGSCGEQDGYTGSWEEVGAGVCYGANEAMAPNISHNDIPAEECRQHCCDTITCHG